MGKILVIIDMQNDFICGSLKSAYAKDVVLPNVVSKIKKGDYDGIVFTRDTHQCNYLETLEGKNLPVVHCVEKSDGWNIHNDISSLLDFSSTKVKCNDKPFAIVNKQCFGAVNLLDAVKNLSQNKVDSIETCGLCTDICVVSNALMLRSSDPSIEIACDSSCCGGTSKEAHDAAIAVMKSCQVKINNLSNHRE